MSTTEIKKFTVDYSKWRCGGQDDQTTLGKGGTYLLNQEGYRCCLGFVESQLGLSDEEIFEKTYPYTTMVENILAIRNDEVYNWRNTQFAQRATSINDNSSISHSFRIWQLKTHFANFGYELEFINVPQQIQDEITELEGKNEW